MARRVSLPAADDLFRPTVPGTGDADPAVGKPQDRVRAVPDAVPDAVATRPAEHVERAGEAEEAEEAARKRASGRVKHEEKMTVYVTPGELIDLERTRLELRATHGLAVDRGRLVREAIDLVLADFHEHGADSMLLRGLLEE